MIHVCKQGKNFITNILLQNVVNGSHIKLLVTQVKLLSVIYECLLSVLQAWV
jgi:hypothetical protein